MPDFAKSPKFIASTIVLLWLVYILWANVQLDPVKFHLIPFAATLDVNVSALVVGSAIFGSIATLIIHWLWRRSSKKASESAAA